MKKLVSVVLCVFLLLSVVFTFVACSKDNEIDELVINNWADYIFEDEKKMDGFKKYYEDVTGRPIKITYVTFDTNETLLTRLTQGDSIADVVCPSEYAIQKLLEMDMLVPLYYFDADTYSASFNDRTKANYVHNGNNVEPQILEMVEQTFGTFDITVDTNGDRQYNITKSVTMTDCFVPYMYGTLGILYNKYAFMDLGIYDEQIMNKANWGILFNDDGEGNILSDGLTGNILMKDSIRDSYAATIFYLQERVMLEGLTNDAGESYATMPADKLINAVDDKLLDKVRQALIEQKEQLFGYEVDFGKDDLLMGNAIVDLAWSGDALYAVEESWNDDLGEEGDYELAYYVPHSAGNIWFDGWVVPKTYNPKHINQIKLFINYLNNPKSAAENFMSIGYTPAIKPEVLLNDVSEGGARSVLSKGYIVNDPDYWDCLDEKGNPITEFDYDSWDEFVAYFFDFAEDGVSMDEIGNSNWRYPFLSAELNADNYRNIYSLGVMRDFGDKNKDVVTAWNYARSSGNSTDSLLLLGWTVLAVAVAVGALFAVIGIKRWRSHTIKLPTAASQS